MLFLVTGMLFWVLFSIALVCLFISVATESPWWGFGIILCFFGCLWAFGYRGNVEGMWHYIASNPLRIVMWFLLYVVVGVGYSFVRWYLLLTDKRRKILELTKKNISVYGNPVPQISENKGKLFNWIFYWPLGVVWDVIDRPFKRLFNFIYDKVAGGYQRMSDKMFAGITKPKTD